MKKLTTIIALALVLTIGGVYAAWNYFQGGASGATAQPRIGMATVSYNGEKGSITADTTALTLLVDDMSTVAGSGVNKQHTAGLTGVGQITINFTANPGADQDVMDNGIKMQATITITKVNDQSDYNGKEALSVSADASKTTFLLNNGVACKTTTIDYQTIIDALVLYEGEELILDTKAKYDAFAKVLSDYQIHINIVEVA